MPAAGRNPTISDAEILREVRMLPDPVVTASEVAERIDMTRQGTNNRLSELTEKGFLKRKEAGSRAVVYWLTDAGKELAATA
jgi:DNA-binding MarR family transcriptional regulator